MSGWRPVVVPGDRDETPPVVGLVDATGEPGGDAALRERCRAIAPPFAGARASRSYRHPFALVAWHPHRVGVDIERVEPYDPAVARVMCMPQEIAEIEGSSNPGLALAAAWSSKEAITKALGDALRYDPARIGAPALWGLRRMGVWRAEALPVPPGYVGWVCWEAAPR